MRNTWRKAIPGGDLFRVFSSNLAILGEQILWMRSTSALIQENFVTPRNELKTLKKITSWNGFPSRISQALIRRFSSNALNKNQTTANNSKDKDEPVTIWLSIPYIGEKTSQLLRSFKRKLRTHLKTLTPRSEFVRKPQNCASTPTTKTKCHL